MSHYKEAPEWWYTILFILAFALAAIVCHYGKLMPWYYLFGKLEDGMACFVMMMIIFSGSRYCVLFSTPYWNRSSGNKSINR